MSDYLSGLYCQGCHEMCPLLAPRCSKGIEWREAAEQQYQASYGAADLEG